MAINIDVPFMEELNIQHIVFDMNGTLAVDGEIPASIKEKLSLLAQKANLYLITADTFGTAAEQVKEIPIKLLKLDNVIMGGQQKVSFVKELGAEHCVTIGNGTNDHSMLKAAKVGIVVIGKEGASVQAFSNANIMVNSGEDAIDLLLHPKRMIATLRP